LRKSGRGFPGKVKNVQAIRGVHSVERKRRRGGEVYRENHFDGPASTGTGQSILQADGHYSYAPDDSLAQSLGWKSRAPPEGYDYAHTYVKDNPGYY